MRLPSLLGALLHHTPHPAKKSPRQESTMAAAAPAPEVESMMAMVALECGGDISASQEEILATSSFLGGDNNFPASQDEEQVFATPPDATQQQEDPVTMCTLPFTPTPSKSPAPPSSQPHSPAPPSSDADTNKDAPPVNPRRKPRVCTRKVRGAKISTPTPSPKEQQPEQQQQPQPEQQQPQPEQQPQPDQPIHVDPLVRAVLMMPTRTTTATSSTGDPVADFIALARQKGIF